MEKLIREANFAARSLLRSKGFAFAVTMTLAACIAVNVAIFAIVNSVLLRPLPVPNAQEIVLMSNRYPKAGVNNLYNSSSGDYYDRQEKVPALQEQAEFRFSDLNIEINRAPERAKVMRATPSLFPLLQVPPLLGRAFTAGEGEPGAEQKAILSYGLWQQLYGGDRTVLGRPLRLSGQPFTIVGVMPRNFVFIDPEVRLWIPAAFTAEEKEVHHSNNWYDIGRLKPNATIAQVKAQVDALNAANLEKFPQMKSILINAGFYTAVEPLADMVVKDVKGPLHLLWAGSAFVLLIGALNVANLVLARLSLRKKEFATRLALGAGRTQLMRQLLVENLILAGASGVLGLLLGTVLLRTIALIGLNHFPRAYEVRVDTEVVVGGALMTLALGVLISALALAGLSVKKFHGVLRDDERTGTGARSNRRVRQSLVVAQIGFAFALLSGAGLLLASFRELLRVDPGFRSQGIITASISAPETKYRDSLQLKSLMDRSLDAIGRTPRVVSVGATTTIPLGGDYNDSVILAEGYEMKPGESVISPRQVSVTPGYMETMGIGLLSGRYFRQSDDRSSPPVILVDEHLAQRFWPGRDPVGQRMYEPDPGNPSKTREETTWYRVVGVVRSVRLEDLSGKGNPEGAYYFPFAQQPSNSFTIAARAAGDAVQLGQALRAQISSVDPDLAPFDIRTMEQREELSLSSRRTSMLLGLSFGALALFLAAIGIYGVLAYLVAQRQREIGIRVALGSTQSGIVKLVLREGLFLVGIGLLLGVTASLSLRSVVASEIYGVGPLDPFVLGTVALLFGLVALGACILPARRAMKVDPVVVLSEQ
ncbi:MAG TPA: ABC transporter permease [Candidatus Sulfotelmatobacter sp.]|nr:ABC transporter permease [Candidatus Sulfotelmatobacter sp.]